MANARSPKHLGKGVRGIKEFKVPSGLHIKFQGDLDYMSPCFKKTKTNQPNINSLERQEGRTDGSHLESQILKGGGLGGVLLLPQALMPSLPYLVGDPVFLGDLLCVGQLGH